MFFFDEIHSVVSAGLYVKKNHPHESTTKNLFESILFVGASTSCQPLRFLGKVSLWRHPGALALHGTSDGLRGRREGIRNMLK